MGKPTYMYRLVEGEIASVVFDSDDLPEGWVDSPVKVKTAPERWNEAGEEKPVTAKRKRKSR